MEKRNNQFKLDKK